MFADTLFQRQLEKTQQLKSSCGPQTALGQRLVELSRAYDHGLFPDETIVEYLDNLVDTCEHQLESFEIIGAAGGSSKNVCFLRGLLQLSDSFEELEHYEIEDAVRTLESELSLGSVFCGVAA